MQHIFVNMLHRLCDYDQMRFKWLLLSNSNANITIGRYSTKS